MARYWYVSALLCCAVVAGCGGDGTAMHDAGQDASVQAPDTGSVIVTPDAGRCETGCLVALVCYAAGATNPSDSCWICDPARSRSAFIANVGASCDDGLSCTGDDACNEVATCVGRVNLCADAALDSGSLDSGLPDSGLPDSGLPDVDSGAPDSGLPDSGAPDSNIPDSGMTDAGADSAVVVFDAGMADASLVIDSGSELDSGDIDSGSPDTGAEDAGLDSSIDSCIPLDMTAACGAAECGEAAAGCGQTFVCGLCSDPYTCGGGGMAGMCGCMPTATECADANEICGVITNHCGGTTDCGPCPEAALVRGALATITGTDLDTVTSLTVDGAMYMVVSSTATTLTFEVPLTASLNPTADLVGTAGTSTVVEMTVAVIDLVINELDSDTLGTDIAEFVEISTGVPAPLDLATFHLVLLNGSSDTSYNTSLELGTTDSNGYFVVGNAAVAPDSEIPSNTIQNGADAVVLVQTLTPVAPGTAIGSLPLIIDALVYDTDDGDDLGLLSPLLGAGPEAIQINENEQGAKDDHSIQRCGPAPLDGRVFSSLATPTPRAPNTCSP